MNVAAIIGERYCLGCGLCVSDVGRERLQMVEQEDGYLVPVPRNGFDGEISALREYCPGITICLDKPLRTGNERMYGPLLDVKAGYANDPTIRFQGSSGGCLTAILCGLIEEGIVEGVVQVGPAVGCPTRTESYFSTTSDQVIANAGSRYAPSSLLINLKQILDEQNRIAVVGKPCDIAALHQYLKVYPDYSKKVYCTLSFMCMGLPSQNATDYLVKSLGIKDPNGVKEFRYRGCGWPGEATAITTDNVTYSCSYHDSWGTILGRYLPLRCKICPDGWGSFADISAGDAWHSNGKGPTFDERPGRSLVLIRSSRGQEIITSLSRYITVCDYDIKELPIIQKSQHARKDRVWSSYVMLKILGDKLLRFKGLGMWSRILKCSPYLAVKEVYGLIRRLNRLNPKRTGHIR